MRPQQLVKDLSEAGFGIPEDNLLKGPEAIPLSFISRVPPNSHRERETDTEDVIAYQIHDATTDRLRYPIRKAKTLARPHSLRYAYAPLSGAFKTSKVCYNSARRSTAMSFYPPSIYSPSHQDGFISMAANSYSVLTLPLLSSPSPPPPTIHRPATSIQLGCLPLRSSALREWRLDTCTVLSLLFRSQHVYHSRK